MQKTILIGYLGNDPELRDTQGKSVCTFSVATTERWKDPHGNRQERTEWHRIVAWDSLAKTCAQYLKKGSRIYLEGKNRSRKWMDQNGVEHYVTEIQANGLEILNSLTNSSSKSGDHVPPTFSDDVPF